MSTVSLFASTPTQKPIRYKALCTEVLKPAGVPSPSSWPRCDGTRLSPAAAADSWFLSPPPGCSLSPAAETPSPQTFWFLFPRHLRPDGGPGTTTVVTHTLRNTLLSLKAIHYAHSVVA